VTIAGQTATVTKVNDTAWKAAYIMQTGDNEGAVSFNISFSDLAGNAGTAVSTTTVSSNSVTFDKTAPTATVTYSKNLVKVNDSLTITATFSEALADTPLVQIGVSGSETVGAANMTKISATQYTYTYTVGNGTGTATVSFGVGTDLAGNLIIATPSSGTTYTIDNTAPAAPTIIAPASQPVAWLWQEIRFPYTAMAVSS
jgi:hypothetical protein